VRERGREEREEGEGIACSFNSVANSMASQSSRLGLELGFVSGLGLGLANSMASQSSRLGLGLRFGLRLNLGLGCG
jgi:hypothetical protein